MFGRTPGRLEVDDAKSDIAERCPHVVERFLHLQSVSEQMFCVKSLREVKSKTVRIYLIKIWLFGGEFNFLIARGMHLSSNLVSICLSALIFRLISF